jgi:LuxR family maltose regulon positive regulatory protein
LARISRFWLKQGEVSRAASWLPDGREVPQDPRHEVYVRQQICRARYLLASRDKAGARQIIDELLAPTQASNRVRECVELWLLQAQHLDGKEIETAVRQALFIAEPAGLVRSFVDEGPAIARMLTQLQGQEEIPTIYLRQLLSAFALEEGGTAGQPLVEPLSQRELEVLRLVAQGYSNQEIAQELVFTVATAKKHMEHILGKLGVRNRTEAVARARELNLL